MSVFGFEIGWSIGVTIALAIAGMMFVSFLKWRLRTILGEREQREMERSRTFMTISDLQEENRLLKELLHTMIKESKERETKEKETAPREEKRKIWL